MTKNDNEAFFVPEEMQQFSCNGGGGALGHPKVYYSFEGKDEVVCWYCSRVFTHKKMMKTKSMKDAA